MSRVASDTIIDAILFEDIDDVALAIAEEKKRRNNEQNIFQNFEYTKAAIQRGNTEILDLLLKENLLLVDTERVTKPQGRSIPIKLSGGVLYGLTSMIRSPLTFLKKSASAIAGSVYQVAETARRAYEDRNSEITKPHTNQPYFISALHLAAKSGRPDLIKFLALKNIISPFLRDGNGETALDIARHFRGDKNIKREMIDILIYAQEHYQRNDKQSLESLEKSFVSTNESKARISPHTIEVMTRIHTTGNSPSAWMDAYKHSKEEREKLRQEFQKRQEKKDEFLDRALNGTLTKMDVSNYLSQGVSIDVVTAYNPKDPNSNETAIHRAVRSGSIDTIEALLDFNLNLDIKNSKGLSALDLAKSQYHKCNAVGKKDDASQYARIVDMIEERMKTPGTSPKHPSLGDRELGRSR